MDTIKQYRTVIARVFREWEALPRIPSDWFIEGVEDRLRDRYVLLHVDTSDGRHRSAPPHVDPENAAAVALLQSWLAEDATDDPEAVRRADEELARLKQRLNADRAEGVERPLFP